MTKLIIQLQFYVQACFAAVFVLFLGKNSSKKMPKSVNKYAKHSTELQFHNIA